MLPNFRFESPTEIISEIGARRRLPDVLDQVNASRVMLLASQRFLETPEGAEVSTLIGSRLATTFGRGKGEPCVADAHQVASIARKNNVDCIVVAGAGTVFGLSKCVAVDLASNGRFEDYSWSVDHRTGKSHIPELPRNVVPIISLPTTAGSG